MIRKNIHNNNIFYLLSFKINDILKFIDSRQVYSDAFFGCGGHLYLQKLSNKG